jgi:hypothetical protein
MRLVGAFGGTAAVESLLESTRASLMSHDRDRTVAIRSQMEKDMLDDIQPHSFACDDNGVTHFLRETAGNVFFLSVALVGIGDVRTVILHVLLINEGIHLGVFALLLDA